MTIDFDELFAIAKRVQRPDPSILRDDGKYYIEEEHETAGFLLRVCDVALLEEDDAECHGGYYRREDGTWMIGFCVKGLSEPEVLDSVSAEVNDREHAITVLWEMRQRTCGYRTGREDHTP